MGVLLTAFGPFGGAAVNASLEAARLLAATEAGIRLIELPVVAGEAERIALAALRELVDAGMPPAFVLSLGEARRPHVSLERYGRNRDDFRIPDNAGNQPREQAIVSEGPDVYEATLPVETLARALAQATPIPVEASESAGAFLCNRLAYCVCHALALEGWSIPYAFIHVPAARPGDGFTVEAIAHTIRAVLSASRDVLLCPPVG